MLGRDRKFYKVFDAADSNLVSGINAITNKSAGYNARDFRNAVIQITATGAFTVKVRGANCENFGDVDFTQAVSATNQYANVQNIKLVDGIPINGDTGIVFGGSGLTAGTYQFEVNINSLDTINLAISDYASGECTATIVLTENL